MLFPGLRLEYFGLSTPRAIRTSQWRSAAAAESEAAHVWRASPDATDSYAAAADDILAALREPPGSRQNSDIDRALDREHGRWVSRSFDRLRTFGYRFDTF